jgi:ribosomal protein L37AE/L43A
MTIKFKCPKCGNTRVEEVMVNVTVSSEIKPDATYHGEDLVDLSYGKQTNEGGEVDHYQCQACGWVLGGDAKQLMAFLLKNKMVEFDDDDGFPN